MKKLILIIIVLSVRILNAQELFVFTEPASNMATGSAGVRLNNSFMKDIYTHKINYHLIPELMFGVSKKLMIHTDAFLSTRSDNKLILEGGSVYAKYRYFSIDDVHSHFRMAAFGRYSFNSSDIHQESIDLNAHNSGYEVGTILTKLLNKVAVSGSVSFLHALDNGNNNEYFYGNKQRDAVNYTLSFGKLLLPKEYTNYKQLNLNAMVELLGQTNIGSGKGYLDIAPSLQVIINSVARIDVGGRIQLSSKLYRTAPEGFFVRLEYNFFNLFKK